MSTVYSFNIITSATYILDTLALVTLAIFTTVFVSPLTATRRQKSIWSIKSVVEIETADPSVSRIAG